MGTAYYIANKFKYLRGICSLIDSLSEATLFKWSDVSDYLQIHPDHQYINIGSSKKKSGKIYVITTKQQYLSQDGISILNERNGAMQFHTVEDAYNYIDNTNIPIENCCVIDNKYKYYKHPEVFRQIQQHLADQPGQRIQINKTTRNAVNAKTNYCYICGKPLGDNRTVDHIVAISRGGTNNINNMMPVHSDCNKFKNFFTTDELLAKATDMVCLNLFLSPNSDTFAKLIRSKMRGQLRLYLESKERSKES